MTYLVIFNSSRFGTEKIRAKSFVEFIDLLFDLVQRYGELPDLIYLISLID
jgi:hypothetical protein